MKGQTITNAGSITEQTQNWETFQELQEQIAHAMCNTEIKDITIIKSKENEQ